MALLGEFPPAARHHDHERPLSDEPDDDQAEQVLSEGLRADLFEGASLVGGAAPAPLATPTANAPR